LKEDDLGNVNTLSVPLYLSSYSQEVTKILASFPETEFEYIDGSLPGCDVTTQDTAIGIRILDLSSQDRFKFFNSVYLLVYLNS
jgi:hypothetical protein